MNSVVVRKLSDQERQELGTDSWPTWQKEVSEFDWYYDMEEHCLFIRGEVIVTTSEGETYRIEEGDYVVFPSGLHCQWKVLKSVLKHFKFV